MKPLSLFALALLVGAATASVSHACDATKTAAGCTGKSSVGTTATAAVVATSQIPSVPASGGCSAEAIRVKTASKTGAACTAEMAANCTPAMREACAKNPAVAAAMGCNPHGKSATTAVTAANTKHMNGAKCDMSKGAMTMSTAAAAGMKCSAHANAVAHDCDACEDWSDCENDVRALNARAQVVGLKNGAMIVYTAERNGDVRALQTLVAKRNDKMMASLSAGSDKKLCNDCKQLRGAVASGKLHREVVNVDRGCMALITSNDRAVVQKIRAMTGQPIAMR